MSNATLVTISGPGAGKRFPIDEECTLGRSFNSDVYIGDLVVSRRHARIVQRQDGRHLLEDLGSGNGTYVNEKIVASYLLQPNDLVRIGGSTFRYEIDPQNETADIMTVVHDALETSTAPGFRVDVRDSSAQLEQYAAQLERDFDTIPEGRAKKMLESMYAVADVIATELDLAKLLDKVLNHLFDVFPQAERGFVFLVNPATGQLVPEAVSQRKGPVQKGLLFSQTLVDQLIQGREALIRGSALPGTMNVRPASPRQMAHAAATSTTKPFSEPSEKDAPKLGAPLLSKGEALGTIHLEGAPGSEPFSQDDLALLSAIARQAAVAITNARAGQSLVQQKRLEDDLRLARQIQQSFLPQRFPDIQGLSFQTHYAPALQVGGDFYDIIGISPTRIGILIGDISGKGVSAALLMAKVTSDIRMLARLNLSPAQVLTNANRSLLESGQDSMFATVIYIVLDLEARVFRIANAGHQPPIVCSTRFSGLSELDSATAVALGVIPEMVYAEESYQLVPGDVVVLYTDGINEAMNATRKEYGIDRLRAEIARGPANVKLVVERIIHDVRRFIGGAAQSDDQTIVAFGLTT